METAEITIAATTASVTTTAIRLFLFIFFTIIAVSFHFQKKIGMDAIPIFSYK